MNGSGRAEF